MYCIYVLSLCLSPPLSFSSTAGSKLIFLQILFSIVLLPFHLPDRLYGLQLFFVFFPGKNHCISSSLSSSLRRRATVCCRNLLHVRDVNQRDLRLGDYVSAVCVPSGANTRWSHLHPGTTMGQYNIVSVINLHVRHYCRSPATYTKQGLFIHARMLEACAKNAQTLL